VGEQLAWSDRVVVVAVALVVRRDVGVVEPKLAAFDARQLGVAPVKVAAAQLNRKLSGYKTPEEKLAAYEAMPEGSEKTAFRKLHREALFAAFSARK